MDDVRSELGLSLSTRPNQAFIYCRKCHRLHLVSQHKPMCVQHNNTQVAAIATPLAILFFPYEFSDVSRPSLIDRPPTPYRYDTDEESIDGEEKTWVSVSPVHSTTVVVPKAPERAPTISFYSRKWLSSLQPWT